MTTGKDYSHRQEWIRSSLEELAGIFALDVMSFAVLSNHLHMVVRTRPDIMKAWSDEDVARRWWSLCPHRRDGNGKPAEPLESTLKHIFNNASGLTEKRRRLCDVSDGMPGHRASGKRNSDQAFNQRSNHERALSCMAMSEAR